MGKCRSFRFNTSIPSKLTHAVDLCFEQKLPYILIVKYRNVNHDGILTFDEF